jgi:hypothetical protein
VSKIKKEGKKNPTLQTHEGWRFINHLGFWNVCFFHALHIK